jgi:hypothetical protein
MNYKIFETTSKESENDGRTLRYRMGFQRHFFERFRRKSGIQNQFGRKEKSFRDREWATQNRISLLTPMTILRKRMIFYTQNV